VHFTKIKGKRVYPTWVSRYYGYKIYIQEFVVTEIYHFTVHKDTHTIYSSIDDMMIFTELEEIIEYIEEWVKENCKDKRGGTAYEEI
jgi:hypothetical protein